MKRVITGVHTLPLLLVFMSVLPGCFAKKSNVLKKELLVSGASHRKKANPSHNPTITVWIHGTRFFPRPLYKEFFKGKADLVPAAQVSQEYKLRLIADILHTADPTLFDLEHLYIFGWSGKLCFKERQQTAELLYTALVKKTREYKEKYGKNPAIRLICHSHGGNVALNLSNIHHTEDITIDELIMLACPV